MLEWLASFSTFAKTSLSPENPQISFNIKWKISFWCFLRWLQLGTTLWSSFDLSWYIIDLIFLPVCSFERLPMYFNIIRSPTFAIPTFATYTCSGYLRPRIGSALVFQTIWYARLLRKRVPLLKFSGMLGEFHPREKTLIQDVTHPHSSNLSPQRRWS